MIIISQNKKLIINFRTVDFIEIMPTDDGRFGLYANFSHCIMELGYYETEKRAKEVLEEILIHLQNKNSIVMDTEKITTEVSSGIYKMPEK